VSDAGIFGFSHSVMVGESEDLRLMDPKSCAAPARAELMASPRFTMP
jgi:hypothetical protein